MSDALFKSVKHDVMSDGVRSMMGKVAAPSTQTSGLSVLRAMAGINGETNGMRALMLMLTA